MTWYYEVSEDNSEMDIIDHTDTVVKTIQNEGTGFQPREMVLQAMEEEALSEGFTNGLTTRQKRIFFNALFENIEQR